MTTPADTPDRSSPMSPLAWLLLGLLSLLWGGSFFFVGVAVAQVPTFTVVVARVGLAAIFLFVFMKISGKSMPRDGRIWVAFFGMGFLNNVIPFSLIVWGQASIASGVASILNATTPIFTVIVAHLLTSDEKLSAGKIAGVVLGFTGVAAMIGGEAVSALGTNVLAQTAILVAALSYAFASVYGRRFKRLGVSPMATATGQVTASTIILLPAMLIIDRPWGMDVPGLDVWAALIALGVLSTSVAYVLYFKILELAGATNLSLVTLLIPVSAITLGILFLSEVLALRHVIGLIMIGSGLVAIDGRLWKRGVRAFSVIKRKNR